MALQSQSAWKLNSKHAVTVSGIDSVRRTSSQHTLSHHDHLQIADTRGSAFAFCPLLRVRNGTKLRQSGVLAGLRWRGWGQQQGHQRPPSWVGGRGWWDTGGYKGGVDLKKINKKKLAKWRIIKLEEPIHGIINTLEQTLQSIQFCKKQKTLLWDLIT